MEPLVGHNTGRLRGRRAGSVDTEFEHVLYTIAGPLARPNVSGFDCDTVLSESTLSLMRSLGITE